MKLITKINLTRFLPLIFWCMALFCYFFQFPLRSLVKFIVPCIFLFAISEWKNIKFGKDKVYLFFISVFYVFLGLECFNSIFHGNEMNRIIRFLEILAFIPFCLFIKEKQFKIHYKVLLVFAFIKSLILIGIAAYVLKMGSHQIVRNYVHSIQGGDVYLASAYRPKIQLQGNGLLPFVFMLYNAEKIRKNIISIVLFLGIIVAGNFAFILCLGLFVLYALYKLICSKKNTYGLITPIILFFFLLCIPSVFKYIDKTRQDKSDFSNAIRVEQATFLTDTNYFVGKGLGNNVRGKGVFRIYENGTYFELQTLYIFNQIGILGLALFYLVLLYWIGKKSKDKLILFLIYLFYTFWNPYCFDTTEMMAIIVLLNLPSNRLVIHKKSRTNFLRYMGLSLRK